MKRQGRRAPAETGLAAWVEEVVAQHARVRRALRADPVHDLRVAIRRVRSLAQGLRSIDDEQGAARWRALSDAGRPLFAGLGELRDAQVMRQHALGLLAGEPAGATVVLSIDAVVRARLVAARAAVDGFSPSAWRGAARGLPARADELLAERALLHHLALRRFHEANALHHEAMRSRASPALHACRIGVKKLRYTVENFLPDAHAQVGKLLKKLQDVLGELHDLDVLLAFVGSEDTRLHSTERGRVGSLVRAARDARVASYRELCIAHDGALPAWQRLRAAVTVGVDVDAAHRALVARRALGRGATRAELELLEAAAEAVRRALAPGQRSLASPRAAALLRLACACALVRDAEGARSGRAARRFARRLPAAHGLPDKDLRLVALVARAAFGEAPRLDEQRVTALGVRDARLTAALGAVLQLAVGRAGVPRHPATRPKSARALPAHSSSRSRSGKRAPASARASRSQA